MLLTIYNKSVSFSDEEVDFFKQNNIEFSSDFFELLLHWIDIDSFDDIPDTEYHDYCINAISDYAGLVIDTINCLEREELCNI